MEIKHQIDSLEKREGIKFLQAVIRDKQDKIDQLRTWFLDGAGKSQEDSGFARGIF